MRGTGKPKYGNRSKVVLSAGSSLLALVICEMVVRIGGFVPQVQTIWRDDAGSFYRRSTNPILSHELKPRFTAMFPTGRATSNSHGFRDCERTLAKPDGIRRIALLGDSVVEGINYVSDEDTLSRRLEEILPETEVLNFGVSGYCTLAEVELLETSALRFEPDEVLVVFTANDFENMVPEHTVAGGIQDRPWWSKKLFVRSAFFRLACLKLNWFAFADEQDPISRNLNALGDNNVVEAFRRLRGLANEHRFRVTIVIWPTFGQEKIFDFRRHEGSRLVVERLAAMFGLPAMRLGPAFRRSFDGLEVEDRNLGPARYFTVRADELHPNAKAVGVAIGALKTYLSDSPPSPPYKLSAPDADAVVAARDYGLKSAPLKNASLVERNFMSIRRQGRPEAFFAYIEELLESDPGNYHANAQLGVWLVIQQRYEEALQPLMKALSRRPAAHEIRVELSKSLYRTRGANEALKLLFEGMEIEPQNSTLKIWVATILRNEGRLSEAREVLRNLPVDDPNQAFVKGMLAEMEAGR